MGECRNIGCGMNGWSAHDNDCVAYSQPEVKCRCYTTIPTQSVSIGRIESAERIGNDLMGVNTQLRGAKRLLGVVKDFLYFSQRVADKPTIKMIEEFLGGE